MINEKTYKKELIRMWDSLRSGEDCKGLDNCYAVNCDYCVLNSLCHDFFRAQDAFEMIEAIEEWSKNHPKKYKVSKFEFDFLEENLKWVEGAYYLKFSEIMQLEGLLEKGYFEGATSETYINDYFDNCEVEEDDG